MADPIVSSASPALKQAWDSYVASLDEMRAKLEATPRFQDTPQHRAKAYHVLIEMQAMTYNFAVAPRMHHPRIFVNSAWQTSQYTLGQNGQDFLYGAFFVDGRQKYKLTGRMGDVTLFLLQTHNGLIGDEGVGITGNYDWENFKLDSSGRFEVTISAKQEPGDWIKIDPDNPYQFLFIRRALPNWHGDPGELSLERMSELPDDFYDGDEFDEGAMANRIRLAEAFLRYLIWCFTINLYDMYFNNAGKKKNILTLLPGTVTSDVGSPSANYAMAVFELQDDEALIIEMDRAPDGVYWSFQVGDVWSRSLNYSSWQTSLNCDEVRVNADGGLTLVVSHQDPGIANWLATCGRVEGTVVFRNYRTKTAPVPSSRKVKFAELSSALPKDIARVTPSQRKAALQRRREGQLRLYGE